MAGAEFTSDEIEILKKSWGKLHRNEVFALFPGRTPVAIQHKATRLGIRGKGYHGVPVESMIGNLTEAERGYLAGLIDGEGCIGITRARLKRKRPTSRTHQYVVFVTIANTALAMTNWLSDKLPFGHVYINNKPGERRKLVLYQWMCAANAARTLLREIAPYLVVKRYLATLVMDGCAGLTEEAKYALYMEARAAKTKGKQRCVIPDSQVIPSV